MAEGGSAGADAGAFFGVAVGDDEGGVAEVGCGEDASEGAGTGAAESVDVDCPDRRVAVDAPGRASSCGGRDGDVACIESGLLWGRVVDAAPRGTVIGNELQPGRCARDRAGDPVWPAIRRFCGELRPTAMCDPEVVDADGGGLIGAVGVALLLSTIKNKTAWPYFLVGFFFASYLGVNMIGIAVVAAVCVALNYYSDKRKAQES